MSNSDDLRLFAEDLNLMENGEAPISKSDLESFSNALTEIGGRNRFGEPNLRPVWGQTETVFAWGKRRLKYPAVFVNEKQTLGYDVLQADGFAKFYQHEAAIPPLKSGELLLPRMKFRRDTIGLPRFIIEYWRSPESLAKDEEEWNAGRWDFDEESRELVDGSGPYPIRGRYEEFLIVQTPDKQFRPLGPDVLERVKTILRIQDSVTKGMSYVDAVKAEVTEIKSKQREALAELGDRMQQAFDTPRIAGDTQIVVPSSYESTPKGNLITS